MPDVDVAIALPYAPAPVFAALTDPERLPLWHPTHESWPAGPPEDLAVGREFVQRTRFMGRSNDVAWTVTAHEAPAMLALEGDAGLGVKLVSTYRLHPVADGTSLQVHARVSGAPRAMQVAMRRKARGLAADTGAGLSALLAADEPGAPAPGLRPSARPRPTVAGARPGWQRALGLASQLVDVAIAPAVRRVGRPPRRLAHDVSAVASAGARGARPARVWRTVRRAAAALRAH
ncbi:hypothetical protein DSM112329_01851 [Paraconexibacter sp. AEG42_29]|uniref:SRPBCC family protein n=1 Tax=Paraconexibacter sp. AEG42_29 TaxID=2997339 RepID=A0AAU7ATI3_9ACTN